MQRRQDAKFFVSFPLCAFAALREIYFQRPVYRIGTPNFSKIRRKVGHS